MQLFKGREADLVVAEIKRRVYILQEHVTDDPEFCGPFLKLYDEKPKEDAYRDRLVRQFPQRSRSSQQI